jgi:hypothetical protein
MRLANAAVPCDTCEQWALLVTPEAQLFTEAERTCYRSEASILNTKVVRNVTSSQILDSFFNFFYFNYLFP